MEVVDNGVIMRCGSAMRQSGAGGDGRVSRSLALPLKPTPACPRTHKQLSEILLFCLYSLITHNTYKYDNDTIL